MSQDTQRLRDTAAPIAERLRDAGVEAVMLPFVDPSMIVRTKTIPLARFESVAASGVGLSTLFNVAMSNDGFALAPGFVDGPSGDLRLRPDPAATVPLVAAFALTELLTARVVDALGDAGSARVSELEGMHARVDDAVEAARAPAGGGA